MITHVTFSGVPAICIALEEVAQLASDRVNARNIEHRMGSP